MLVMRSMEHSSRNAPIGLKKLNDFVFVCIVFLGFLWVLNIPKWWSNDSGPIAVLFKWILELPKFTKHRPSLDLWTPYLLPKYCKNTRKLWEHQAWVYGLRWRPVCCIFFLSDFLGFRHAIAFSFLVFLDSGMSLHFILCFVLRLFRCFRLCVSLRSFDSLILWLSFVLSIIQEGDAVTA